MSSPLPKKGQRSALPVLHGCADALWLRNTAALLKQQKKMLLVLIADTACAQHLLDEICWFDQDSSDATRLQAHLLPDWETLPYDQFSPHQDLISERLATLYALQNRLCDILLVPATTALLRLPPLSFLAAYTFVFKKSQLLDVAQLRAQFTTAGYNHVSQVMAPGEYAVRGSLIDLFPMGSAVPYRIDLFDDAIESIRAFDPDTQRSLYPVPEVRLLPAHEFPMHEAARQTFRNRWREIFEGDASKTPIYRDISQGIAPAGIEYYLPLFFENTASIFEYLPEDAVLALHGDLSPEINQFWQEIRGRYQFMRASVEHPVLDPEYLYLSHDDFFIALQNHAQYKLTHAQTKSDLNADIDRLSLPLPDIAVNRQAEDPLSLFRRFVEQADFPILLVAESLGRQETLQQYLAEHGLQTQALNHFAEFAQNKAALILTSAPLHAGFIAYFDDQLNSSKKAAFAVVTENELYARSPTRIKRRTQESNNAIDSIIRDLSELKIGQPVVHINHGVGRYQGLITMDLGDGETEFLHIEYAENTKLYVPVSQLHLITRYSSVDTDKVSLHALGSAAWEKARKKAEQQIRDTAAELLNIYAQRSLRGGHAFTLNWQDYNQFAEQFGFEETPDQALAINAVIQDMTSGKAMDRLICGDVGFGKTEVALRSAFIAVMNGYQVAVLAPTTLLVEQHMQTFSDRFAKWPVRIAELSRFRTAKETQQTMTALANGQIDIVIGTHKLLSKQMQFTRLGLVIIDEEHRFGVRHKEMLKSLRNEVDILTLTATPIPRTLGMVLDGLRDFSVIATAPQRRLSIKTFVRKEEKSIIREACLRELKRGGQVYFLHNEVESIEQRKQMLTELLPEARIAIAHGQMHERDLEKVMRDFVNQRFNILLCTTIIETGIDVSTANTIVMHRADRFGLAQLHQLRGRVGRSHHQAYAYLLVHDLKSLTRDAEARLDAIQQMEQLGSGFYLSMHDLEIRGAGEILGENQSGEMQQIGFQLYTDLLNKTIEALKRGEQNTSMGSLVNNSEINLHLPALLPKDYCSDIQQRLSLYKRFSNCQTEDELILLREELVDRFGSLPLHAQTLLATHRLRIQTKIYGIIKLEASSEMLSIQFCANPPVKAESIIRLIQKNRHIRLHGQDRIKVMLEMPDLEARLTQIKVILSQLELTHEPALTSPKN